MALLHQAKFGRQGQKLDPPKGPRDLRVEGRLLVCPQRAILPNRCVKTNNKAHQRDLIREELYSDFTESHVLLIDYYLLNSGKKKQFWIMKLLPFVALASYYVYVVFDAGNPVLPTLGISLFFIIIGGGFFYLLSEYEDNPVHVG